MSTGIRFAQIEGRDNFQLVNRMAQVAVWIKLTIDELEWLDEDEMDSRFRSALEAELFFAGAHAAVAHQAAQEAVVTHQVWGDQNDPTVERVFSVTLVETGYPPAAPVEAIAPGKERGA